MVIYCRAALKWCFAVILVIIPLSLDVSGVCIDIICLHHLYHPIPPCLKIQFLMCKMQTMKQNKGNPIKHMALIRVSSTMTSLSHN